MKRSLIALLIAAGAIAAVFTCTATGPSMVDDRVPAGSDVTPERAPFVTPDPPRPGTTRLPDYGRDHPEFPWLPREVRIGTRSVGSVTDGFLVDGRAIPHPHPRLDVLPPQFERGFHYTTDPMLHLLEAAADHVAEAYPGTRTHLGNLSAPGGGDIPQSVSHNNGRDADIAFFAVDENGEPIRPPDLLSFDEQGRFDGSEREETDHPELFMQFDTSRNWRLIEGLIESNAADLQFIFVSRPLRQMLLDEAERQEASAEAIAIAREVLLQPGGDTLPHDDHFHIRIHCTPVDLAAGCEERGRPGPTFRPDLYDKRQVIERALALLDDPDYEHRATAIRRLDLMPDHGAHRRIAKRIDDPAAGVRAAAVRALRDHPPAATELMERLGEETSPHVFAELVDALVALRPDATDVLVDALHRDLAIDLGPGGSLSATSLVANALARTERAEPVPHLIEALDGADTAERIQIAHALRILTNHRFAQPGALRDQSRADAAVDAWQNWWNEHGEQDRDEWLLAGFTRAGYDLESLGEDAVWTLCRAIRADRRLSYNAQRVLAEIAGDAPDTVDWHPHDASFYWRHWFEERIDEMSLPEIPAELSTADGYTPPP